MFTGNRAPYHITQPSTDNDVQVVSPNATMTSITCSLNITIPSTVIVTWSHNTSLITDSSQITTTASTTTLLIGDLQPSDAGVYQCVFNDSIGSGWVLQRKIRLLITGMIVATCMKLCIHNISWIIYCLCIGATPLVRLTTRVGKVTL